MPTEGFDDLIAPLGAERAEAASALLHAWRAEADRDAARQRFLALKDAWQYLEGDRRDALLREAGDGLAGAPHEELKRAALALLDDDG